VTRSVGTRACSVSRLKLIALTSILYCDFSSHNASFTIKRHLQQNDTLLNPLTTLQVIELYKTR